MTETFTSPISGGIDELWERRADLTPDDADARAAIVAAVDQIDTGEAASPTSTPRPTMSSSTSGPSGRSC